MGEFTVLVEAGTNEGEWLALAPPQSTAGDSAAEVARWTATEQDVTEGSWRVRVWDGRDADISAEPAAEVYSNTL
jgi:hypothetical protein